MACAVASFWTLLFRDKRIFVAFISAFLPHSNSFWNAFHRPFAVEANRAEVKEGNGMQRQNLTGRQVAYWRCQKKWTQTTLAARLQCLGYGISREMLAKIELGLRGVEDNWLDAFQKVFNLPIIRFFPQEIQDFDAKLASNPAPPKKPRRKCQQKLTNRPKRV